MPIWEYACDSNVVKRHLFSSLRTILVLLKNKPSIICLQYSFLLLIVIAVYKALSFRRVFVICDCHTKALRRRLDNRLGTIFNALKLLSFRSADMSIVSNDLMLNDIRRFTDRFFILPDKIPELIAAGHKTVNEPYCVFVGAFAVDEPIDEVIAAARILASQISIYCTGRIPTRLKYLQQQPHTNIHFTNYLSENDYISLIANAHCILALTTEEGCLQCAGYEALSLNVPLIVSRTDALTNYFGESVIYVDNSAESIVQGVRNALHQRDILKLKMERIRSIRKKEYEDKFHKLSCLIDSML